jgi:hypothetical protein
MERNGNVCFRPIADIHPVRCAVVTGGMTFTELEEAALRSIFSETLELAAGLERQLAVATVTERENSGAGFFTTIRVPDEPPRVESPKVLGYETHAHIKGIEYGLGFVLFMKDGALHMLEGYALAGSTSALDLADLRFEVFRVAQNQAVPPSPFNPA